MALVIGAGAAGYVLAGGRSSRMGVDKALVELGGRPLVALAVEKLRRVTGSAAILAGPEDRPASARLERFGPLVFDLHPGCGPLSGIEAALSHSEEAWNLILPVDVPFLPAALLGWWLERMVKAEKGGARASVFRVGGELQPAVLLIHRAMAPYVAEAIARGEYKLMRMLERAALMLSEPGAEGALRVEELPEAGSPEAARSKLRARLTPAEWAAQGLWFANVNTPEELAEARRHESALG